MIYGLPLDKKFPLNCKEEIIAAISNFNSCHKVKRTILADNINRELARNNMIVKVPEDSEFRNYIDEDYFAGITGYSRYNRVCNSVCEIPFDGSSINDYNRRVFEHMVECGQNIKDDNEYSSFLQNGNEYADSVMKNNAVLPREMIMCMEIVENICDSLVSIILDYSPSEYFVKKLLEDLEELFILYATSTWYMRRKVLRLNHLASRIGRKNDVNKLIAMKTQQLMNNETSLFNQLKISKAQMKHLKDCDNSQLLSYLKDKQMELKSYFDLQYGYFLCGDPIYYKKQAHDGFNSIEYTMFECMQNQYMLIKGKESFLKKYPKLSLDIDYGNFFRLRSKYKNCKQFSINNAVITLLVLNNLPYIVCKRKDDNNVLYLVKYDDIIGNPFPKSPPKAIKVKFKNKVFEGDVDNLIKSSMKF